MRKFHLLGLALFALLAFGAVVASEAFALESVWLEGGVKPAEALLVDGEGELALEDKEAPGGAVALLCSGLLEGFIGGDKTGANPKWDEVTRITDLAGNLPPILCTFVKRGACESEATSPPTASPLHLPWLTELTLDAGGQFLDLLVGTGGNPGWEAACLVLGFVSKDECTSPDPTFEIDNTTENDVLALISGLITENALCSLSGKESGVVTGEVLILAASGESLAVSEA